VERVLPSPEIKSRIAGLAVGLAADCDDPEPGLEEVMHSHLPDAKTLPFAGFVTPDGKWVDGWSGYKDAGELAAVLTAVEQSPVLLATPAVRAQLGKLAEVATAAAERGDWKAVLRAWREGDATTGRCEERVALAAAEKRARDWVAAQFAEVIRDCTSGADLAAARKKLADVRSQFAGEPEAAEADAGAKALVRLQQIRAAEARPNPARDLREKAAQPYQGTRWTAVFDNAPAAPAKDASQDGATKGK